MKGSQIHVPDIIMGIPAEMNVTEMAIRNVLNMSRKIFGVSWDGGSNPVLTRTDDAVGMVANVGVDSQVVVNNFDSAPIFRRFREVYDSYGNKFIRIPKFYIKKGGTAPARTWHISEYPHAGFYLPWCFWDFTNSRANQYIDVGAYVASLSADTTKLESKTGTIPLVNRNIVDYRTLAKANGAGYQQLDIHVMDVLVVLMTVEFANLDIQTIMQGFTSGQYSASHTAVVAETAANRIIITNANAAGYVVGQNIDIGTSLGGRQIAQNREIASIDTYDVSNKAIVFSGAAVNVAIGNIVYNVAYTNGKTDAVTASSGSHSSNSDAKRQCKYRGIESPFGNAWQWVDGVNINERQAWIARNASDFASNVFASPYRQLGYVNSSTDGYVSVMGADANNPEAEFAVTVSGGSATFYADYYYQSTGQRVARVGGYWGNGRDAGPRSWTLVSSSSHTYLTIAGRLLKKPS